MNTKTITLAEWIEKESVNTVSKALRVEKSTVWNWRRGYCLPTADKMERIEKLSKGAVTRQEMVAHYWSDANGKNRNQSKR